MTLHAVLSAILLAGSIPASAQVRPIPSGRVVPAGPSSTVGAVIGAAPAQGGLSAPRTLDLNVSPFSPSLPLLPELERTGTAVVHDVSPVLPGVEVEVPSFHAEPVQTAGFQPASLAPAAVLAPAPVPQTTEGTAPGSRFSGVSAAVEGRSLVLAGSDALHDGLGRTYFDGARKGPASDAADSVASGSLDLRPSGLTRPSGKKDGKQGTSPSEPSWSPLKRYGILSSILAGLAVLPSAVNAAPLLSIIKTGQAVLGGNFFTLGLFPNFPLLALAAVILGIGGIPLRRLAYRCSPWEMKSTPDPGEKLAKDPLWKVVPLLLFGAAFEEFAFRGMLLPIAAALLFPFLPHQLLAYATASFLVSLAFALVHGYGPVWTRVVGGMLYAGAMAATGSILFPIFAHFAFNMTLTIQERRKKA